MKGDILLVALVLIFAISLVGAQEIPIYYKLNLNYNEGQINISSIEIQISQDQEKLFIGDYVAEVLDFEEQVLNFTFFNVPNEVYYDYVDPETGEIDGGGISELNQVSFELYVPYYEGAKEIIIYNKFFEELAQIEVSSYSKEKPIEISGKSVEDFKYQETEQKEILDYTKNIQDYWWVFLIVLIVLIFVLVYSLRKK